MAEKIGAKPKGPKILKILGWQKKIGAKPKAPLSRNYGKAKRKKRGWGENHGNSERFTLVF